MAWGVLGGCLTLPWSSAESAAADLGVDTGKSLNAMEKATVVCLHTFSQPSSSRFPVGRNSDHSGWGLGLRG